MPISCSPQSTQYVLCCRLCLLCSSSGHRLAARLLLTTSPHIGQKRTGVSERRWFMLLQAIPLLVNFSPSSRAVLPGEPSDHDGFLDGQIGVDHLAIEPSDSYRPTQPKPVDFERFSGRRQ